MTVSPNTALLAPITSRLLFGLSLFGGGLFVSLSSMENLGLSGAGEPERWALGRMLTLIGWWLPAVGLYLVRHRLAYRQSLVINSWICGLVAFALATLWFGMTSGLGIYLSALLYTLLSILWALTIRQPLLAALLGITVLLLQIATDILVLGLLGEFSIH